MHISILSVCFILSKAHFNIICVLYFVECTFQYYLCALFCRMHISILSVCFILSNAHFNIICVLYFVECTFQYYLCALFCLMHISIYLCALFCRMHISILSVCFILSNAHFNIICVLYFV